MIKYLLKPMMIFILLFMVSVVTNAQTQIIINEFSQGDPGTTHEWIELVVTANNTNIQGVYLDKDDDANSNGNRWDDIHLQLSTTYAPFASVSKGAIIVIYRNEDGGNKDPRLPADDLIFTDDNKILIPHNDTNGFLESGATWPPLLVVGDAFGIFNSDLTGIHGIAYGTDGTNWQGTWSTAFPSGTSWGMTDITSVEVGSGQSAMFTEGTPGAVSTASNWSVQPYDSVTVTPGALNGGNNNALPVELTSFAAILKGNVVQLNWMTATEVNNYGFDVERKREGGDWNTLGFVEGNGNSNSPKEYSFLDNDVVTSGKYFYRLKQVDNDGSYEYSQIIQVDFNTPVSFELKQNYPNPFNPSTTITFTLPVNGNMNLSVFNMLGEEIQILQNGFLEAGMYSYNFNAEGLPSGIYIYKLFSNNKTQTRKMLLLK